MTDNPTAPEADASYPDEFENWENPTQTLSWTGRFVAFFLVILSLAGIADALALTATSHLSEGYCVAGAECGQVLASTFAHLQGLHWTEIGLAAYCFVFATSALIFFGRSRFALWIMVFATTIGVFTSAYLVYLQGWRIGHWCSLCLISAGLQLALFLGTLHLFYHHRRCFRWAGFPSLLGTYLIAALVLTLLLAGQKTLWEKVGNAGHTTSNLVAIIDGRDITTDGPELSQLTFETKQRIHLFYQSWYRDHLFNKYAIEKGHGDRGSLIDKKLAENQKDYSDEVLRKLYDKDYRSSGGIRYPFEQVKEDFRRELEERDLRQVEYDLIQLIEKEYEASFIFPEPEPPFVKFTPDPALTPILGDPTAPIQIVMFVDFGCPYCRMVQGEMRKIREQYPDQIALTYRNFPTHEHPYAGQAARAAIAAWKQGGFWPYTFALYEKQGHGIEKDETYLELAREQGLDLEKFHADRHGQISQDVLDRDAAEAKRADVNRAPSVYINGFRMIKNPTAEAMIDKMRQLNLIPQS